MDRKVKKAADSSTVKIVKIDTSKQKVINKKTISDLRHVVRQFGNHSGIVRFIARNF